MPRSAGTDTRTLHWPKLLTSLSDDGRFETLAAEREKRGLSQRDISELTRIPMHHLACLERGALDEIPEGPYIDGYYRDYCRALGLTPVATPFDAHDSARKPPMSKPLVPLSVVRLVAALSVCSMLGWFLFQALSSTDRLPGPAGESPQAVLSPGDQVVRVHVRKTGRFLVSVDGSVVLDDRVEEGTRMSFIGQDSVEIVLPGVGYVHLEYNGRNIVPQGLQNQPRTILFLDDVERLGDE